MVKNVGVEPDYLLYSKVSAGCIPRKIVHPSIARVRGGRSPPAGWSRASDPLAGVRG